MRMYQGPLPAPGRIPVRPRRRAGCYYQGVGRGHHPPLAWLPPLHDPNSPQSPSPHHEPESPQSPLNPLQSPTDNHYYESQSPYSPQSPPDPRHNESRKRNNNHYQEVFSNNNNLQSTRNNNTTNKGIQGGFSKFNCTKIGNIFMGMVYACFIFGQFTLINC